MVTGQDLRLHTPPSHLQHHLGLLHLEQMHTAQAPQAPEQHLGSGSGRFRGLRLTEGSPGVGGNGDVSALCYLNTELPEHWAHTGRQGEAAGEGLSQGCQVLWLHVAGH